ncbi:hypothetical protein AB852_00585 [Streptomyces uncialis]|uniref:Uncharacterized protein n=1 Tax=Streptomyces uncialis TaxID=1048205 RepID=A0A1Q4VC26_9ACTN|nr:hypothetical protein AB852_00585 [Streptomyces uncialis]
MRILREVAGRIQQCEAEWLSVLQEEVPTYDVELNRAADGSETDRMDEVQADQAEEARGLLREVLAMLQPHV